MENTLYQRNGKLLYKKFREYLIPSTLSGLSMMLGVVVDGIIVGNTISADAMAAVNVAQPLVICFQALFFLFGIGGATVVAVSKGERDQSKANRAFSVSAICLMLSSLVFIILGFTLLDPLVALICTDAHLYPLAKDYLHVLMLGAPVMLLVPGSVYFVRADGFPKLSGYILLVANAVNLLMDLVYIEVFDMGISGAALATLTGYVVGLAFIVYYFLSKKRTLKFSLPKKPAKLFSEICGRGSAGAVNTLLLIIKMLCLNLIVLATGGADAMAVYAVCNFAISFISMFACGASDAMVPLLGILYGEKDWQGIKFVSRRTLYTVTICCLASIALIELLPEQILGIFNIEGAANLAMGTQALRIFAISLLGLGISFTMMYYQQTLKHRGISLMITVLRGFVFIVPVAFVFAQVWGLPGVWWAYVVAEALTVAVTFAVCKAIQVRNKDKYSGIFLVEKEEPVPYTATLPGSHEAAVGLSGELISYCNKLGVSEKKSNLVGLVAEETVVYICEHNGAKPFNLDALCRVKDKEVVLNLRDNGSAFEDFAPMEKSDPSSFDSVTVLHKVSTTLDYTGVLGLNNSTLVIALDA